MTDEFTIKRGNTSPAIRRTLSDSSGPVTLTGATVTFKMADSEGVLVVESEADVTDAENGEVTYDWVSEDTAEAGVFFGEFQVVYADQTEETFPNEGYIKITITKDL